MKFVKFDRRYRLYRQGWVEGLVFDSTNLDLSRYRSVHSYLDKNSAEFNEVWNFFRRGPLGPRGPQITIAFREPGTAIMVILAIDQSNSVG